MQKYTDSLNVYTPFSVTRTNHMRSIITKVKERKKEYLFIFLVACRLVSYFSETMKDWLMAKYAGVEFANPSSQWEARAYCPDIKKQDNFDQIHAYNIFKWSGVYINLHLHI
jgi:hypothetical protein